MAVDRDGRIIVAGGDNQLGGRYSYLARLRYDGRPDLSFGRKGRVQLDLGVVRCRNPDAGCSAGASGGSSLTSIALQGDGKIVVAGFAVRRKTNSDFVIARLTSEGKLDRTFSQNGVVTVNLGGRSSNDGATSVLVSEEDKILVAGLTTEGLGVVRLSPDGSVDSSFSGNGALKVDDSELPCVTSLVSAAAQIAEDSQGRLLVSGNTLGCVFRLNTDGSLDSSFGQNGFFYLSDKTIHSFEPSALLVQPDGKAVLAGTSEADDQPRRFIVERVTTSGELDLSFSGDGLEEIAFKYMGSDAFHRGGSLALQHDGKIVLGGALFNRQKVIEVIARLTPDGAPDRTFSSDGRKKFGFGRLRVPSISYYFEQQPSRTSVAITPQGGIVAAAGWFRGRKRLDFAVAQLVGTR